MTTAPAQAGEMPRAYDPGAVEGPIYKFWNDSGFFTPAIDRSKQPFTVIMPPPNVTGELHMGHALTIAVEDLMVRLASDARRADALSARHRSRRHRYAGGGGEATRVRWDVAA